MSPEETPKTNNKNKMTTNTLHRQIHPVHWHVSMIVAIATILLTSIKCSGEMLSALHIATAQAGVMSSVDMRGSRDTEIETGHDLFIVSNIHHAVVGSR